MAPAQVGQIAIALQADHDHRVGAILQDPVIAGCESGAVGKDQEEPIGMVSEQVRNARQQEWFSTGDHERHHTQSNRFVHDSVPVAEAESRLGRRARDGPHGSGEAANAAQIAFGSDAENQKGRHSHSAGKLASSRAPRLPNRPRQAEESWKVARMD
jgi:hypothetical protein